MRQSLDDIALVEGDNELNVQMALAYRALIEYIDGDYVADGLRNLGIEICRYWPIMYITPEEFEGYIMDETVRILALFGHSNPWTIQQIYLKPANGMKEVPWNITPARISKWLENRPPPMLTYLFGCRPCDYTGEGTLSYAFRKGKTEGTATVGWMGYDDISDVERGGVSAWTRTFWDSIFKGKTFYEAFTEAGIASPSFAPHAVFAGDKNIGLWAYEIEVR